MNRSSRAWNRPMRSRARTLVIAAPGAIPRSWDLLCGLSRVCWHAMATERDRVRCRERLERLSGVDARPRLDSARGDRRASARDRLRSLVLAARRSRDAAAGQRPCRARLRPRSSSVARAGVLRRRLRGEARPRSAARTRPGASLSRPAAISRARRAGTRSCGRSASATSRRSRAATRSAAGAGSRRTATAPTERSSSEDVELLAEVGPSLGSALRGEPWTRATASSASRSPRA